MTGEIAFSLFDTALNNISERYYSWSNLENTAQQTGERVFCYELYHQFQLLLFLKKMSLNEDELRLDAELSKYFFSEEINSVLTICNENGKKIYTNRINAYKKAEDAYQEEIKKNEAEEVCKKETSNEEEKKSELIRKTIIPDFVFHKKQENKNGQYLVCEVKNGQCNGFSLIRDIFKLYFYVSPKGNFKFEKAVFLCINCNFQTLKKSINKYFFIPNDEENEEITNSLKKIVVMGGKYGNIKYETLFDIIRVNS